MKITIKKGYRKFIAFIISLIFAVITGLIFKAEILIPVLSFAGTALTVFFAANYGEHREENRSNYGEINQEEYHGE